MKIGDLRHRITLRRPNRVDDPESGETVTTYVDAGTGVPASVWPKGPAGETVTAAQQTARVSYEIRIRFVAGVGTDWRIVLADGRVLEILTAVDPDERHRELRITAVDQIGATPNA